MKETPKSWRVGRAAALAVSSLLACSPPSAPRIHLDLPDVEAGTFVLTAEIEGRLIDPTAFVGALDSWHLPAGGQATLWLVALPSSPERLGLTLGRLDLETVRGRPLGAHPEARVFSATQDGTRLSAWAELAPSPALEELRLPVTDDVNLCERTVIEDLAVPAELELERVVVRTDGRLLAAGTRGGHGVVGTLEADLGAFHALMESEAADRIDQLAFDGERTVYGASFNHLVQLDLESEAALVWAKPEASPRVREVAMLGPDEAVAFPGFWDLTRGSTRTQPRPDVPDDVAFVRSTLDALYVVTSTNDGRIHRFSDGAWTVDFVPPPRTEARKRPRRLAGASDRLYAYSGEALYLRHGPADWRELPLPFKVGIQLLEIILLPQDTVMMTGDAGFIVLEARGERCTLELPTNRFLNRTPVVLPDGRVLVYTGRQPSLGLADPAAWAFTIPDVDQR